MAFLSVSTDISGKNNGLSALNSFSHPLKENLLLNAIERWAGGTRTWFTLGADRGKATCEVSVVDGFRCYRYQCGVVADIDCKSGGYTKRMKNFSPQNEEALQFISVLPFKPSMIILERVADFKSIGCLMNHGFLKMPGDREKASASFPCGGNGIIVARGKEKGWKLDSVGSLEHLFRIPGTYNHKADPVPVEIIEMNDFRYSVESIKEFLEDIPDEQPHEKRGGGFS